MRKAILAAAVFVAAPTNTVFAQDVGGALNLGQLTGTLSQDHVTQSERARTGHRKADGTASATARRNCASVPKLRARYGADDPRIGKVVQLCQQAGYPVR